MTCREPARRRQPGRQAHRRPGQSRAQEHPQAFGEPKIYQRIDGRAGPTLITFFARARGRLWRGWNRGGRRRAVARRRPGFYLNRKPRVYGASRMTFTWLGAIRQPGQLVEFCSDMLLNLVAGIPPIRTVKEAVR